MLHAQRIMKADWQIRSCIHTAGNGIPEEGTQRSIRDEGVHSRERGRPTVHIPHLPSSINMKDIVEHLLMMDVAAQCTFEGRHANACVGYGFAKVEGSAIEAIQRQRH